LPAAAAFSQVVEPGTYKCWTPGEIIEGTNLDPETASELVSGYCKYRGKGFNGKSAFAGLDRIAQRIIRRDAPNVVNYIEPRADTNSFTITWWIEGDKPNEVHPANHVIGRQLQLADVKYPFTRVPAVEIRAMVFSLDQTKEREIGLDIASYFTHSPDADAGPIMDEVTVAATGPGILNIVGRVADSLSSAITLGFSLSSEKSYAKEQLAINTLCPIGEFCTFEDLTENYIMTPTGVEKARLGIRYQMRPLLGLEEGEIQLDSLEFYLGLKTDDPLAPVNFIKPINYHTYILKDGELHVLGSEIRDFDAKGSRLLGKNKQSVHSRMILLMSVSLRDRQDEVKNSGVFTPKVVDRSFSPEELKTLDSRAGFYSVLSSIETVCFADVMNPLRNERICGFHLTEMNPAFVDYWVTLRIAPKAQLKYPGDQIRTIKLGDIYQGKGYYQIPMLRSAEDRHSMKLRIELAKGGSGEDLRKTHRSGNIPLGMTFEFAYTSGHHDPVDIRTSSIAPVNR